jgi:hypothetical protein
MGDSGRLSYLVYRCEKCHRPLTCYEIEARWEKQEKGQSMSSGICPCGSGRICPTNLTLWEELTLPRVWRLWWGKVVKPWFQSKA